jgi:hypothetical protein
VERDETRLTAERVYREMRREWIELQGVRVGPDRDNARPITRLYVAPFPRYMVAPWEDYEAVWRAELPDPTPLDQAPAETLPDGTVLYRRPGQLPVVIEPD